MYTCNFNQVCIIEEKNTEIMMIKPNIEALRFQIHNLTADPTNLENNDLKKRIRNTVGGNYT